MKSMMKYFVIASFLLVALCAMAEKSHKHDLGILFRGPVIVVTSVDLDRPSKQELKVGDRKWEVKLRSRVLMRPFVKFQVDKNSADEYKKVTDQIKSDLCATTVFGHAVKKINISRSCEHGCSRRVVPQTIVCD